MLLLDRERAQQRVRLVDLEAHDADTDLTLGGDDKGIEHGDVQILHRQLGCAQQPGDRIKLRWPRRSQLELGHGSSLSADDGAKHRAHGNDAPQVLAGVIPSVVLFVAQAIASARTRRFA